MPAQGLISIPTFLRPKGLEPFKRNRKRGFTLIELMVTISIIAILATVGYVTYSKAQIVARDAKRRQDLRSMISALELYYQQNNQKFPTEASGLKSTAGVSWSNFLAGDISQMPIDPINDATTHNYLYTSSDGSTYLLCASLENPLSTDNANSCTGSYNFGIAGAAF